MATENMGGPRKNRPPMISSGSPVNQEDPWNERGDGFATPTRGKISRGIFAWILTNLNGLCQSAAACLFPCMFKKEAGD